jgi:hypothetical protein
VEDQEGQQPDETILEEAQRLILGDRNQSYDHPLDNFNRIARIWSVIFGFPVSAEQVGLAMVGVKLAREAYSPKRDNLVDGAGYFGTVQMVIDERQRRTNPPAVIPVNEPVYNAITTTAYCIVCKQNHTFTGVIKTSDSGRKVAMGNCPSCGGKVNRILGKDNG